MPMTLENLLLERDGAIAVVTVNRPKAMNSLNIATMTELENVFSEFAKTPDDVRAIVLTGAGEKSFVAGADIPEIHDLDLISGKDFAARGLRIYSIIEKLRTPVIAAVNGYALGGGCELAMACHLRIASENAKFGQPEINLGIIPGYGGTQRLSRLVGRGRALDLLLTGRMIPATEALQWGLVNAVVPQSDLLTTARKLAIDLASKPRLATLAILEAVERGLQVGLDQALQIEENLFSYCCGTSDMKEGTAAFQEKRKAEFKGR
jgi:enoyl-CoA hydratase